MNKHYAIKVLKDLRIFDDDCDEDCEALDMAVEALEKQIPKKPIFESEQTSLFGVDDVPYCPSCRCELPEVSYCEKCGQALDWSDTDEMPNIKSKE